MRGQCAVYLLAFLLLSIATRVESADPWDRGISIERAMKAADIAAGFPSGRPNNFDVVTAKLILSNHFDVDNELLASNLEDMKSLSPPKRFWLIVYRRWPPRLDDDLVVFIDANSGEPIRVYRTKAPSKTND
jgi:hypothetical protein